MNVGSHASYLGIRGNNYPYEGADSVYTMGLHDSRLTEIHMHVTMVKFGKTNFYWTETPLNAMSTVNAPSH